MMEIFAVSSPFAMVVLIVAIVFGAKIWRTHLLTKARNTRSHEDEAIIGSMQSQIDRLTERVQVLERLVTDDDRRLAREIDSLRGRDRPSV
jgi:phage shock protein B